MSKNFWQRDRNTIFKDLVSQYEEEGYNKKEARKLAKQEADEVMLDKEDFVSDIWESSYDEG
tara:strand:+ start:156 stop:341 length:186 start_codon:yes stop_codon:yes gene_type:complete